MSAARRLVFLASLFSALAPAAQAAEWYVSPLGNNNNAGTQAAPFQTLDRARRAVAAALASSTDPGESMTVWFMAGTYRMTSQVAFVAADSGKSPTTPVLYTAVPGAQAILTGATAIDKTRFTPATNNTVLSRIISSDARSRILQCDLRAAGITDFGVLSRHGYFSANLAQVAPVQLYINGERMRLARWPNPGDYFPALLTPANRPRHGVVARSAIIAAGPTQTDAAYTQRGGTFSVSFDRLQSWTSAPEIWLDGIFGQSWEWSYNRIASIDLAQKRLTLAYGEPSGIINGSFGDFFFAENLLEEIDEPGEYYLDRASGLLYLYPPADWTAPGTQIEMATLDTRLIALNATANVTFRDLILEKGRDDAIDSVQTRNIRIERCELRDFAGDGIVLDGTANAVVASHVHHIGGAAIALSGGDLTTLAPSDSVAEGNHLHDWGWYQKAYYPAVRLRGVRQRVANNHLHSAPHVAVLLASGNDHVIEGNDIHDVVDTFMDAGAIYSSSGDRPLERGHFIRRNYLHDIGRSYPAQNAIYPDDEVMGWTIEQNIIARIGANDLPFPNSFGVNNNTGAYINVRNNIFVDCAVPCRLSRNAGDNSYPRNLPLWQNLFATTNVAGLPHAQRYPELLNFFTEARQFPDTDRYDNNVVWNPNVALRAASGATIRDGGYDETGKLQYGTNFVATTNPGFVDDAASNFALRSDSVVPTRLPSFTPINPAQIGPQGGVGAFAAEAPSSTPIAPPGRIVNLSIRTSAGTGDNTLIVGLSLNGATPTGTKAVLIRGVGPSLGVFGVGGALADSVITMYDGSAKILAQNDDWAGGFDFASIGAFNFAGNPVRDAALYNTALGAGSYSIQITGKNNATGVALAEIYDAAPAANFTATTPRLVNVSARARVGTGENILIAGIVVGGSTPVRVLIRAIGPTLSAFGVGGALADPKLELYSGSTKLNENDNWGGTADLSAAFTAVGAFALSPASRDSALLVTLAPGSYTAQVSGVTNTTGVALVEVYDLTP